MKKKYIKPIAFSIEIDDEVDLLSGSLTFTIIDLGQGYYQKIWSDGTKEDPFLDPNYDAPAKESNGWCEMAIENNDIADW